MRGWRGWDKSRTPVALWNERPFSPALRALERAEVHAGDHRINGSRQRAQVVRAPKASAAVKLFPALVIGVDLRGNHASQAGNAYRDSREWIPGNAATDTNQSAQTGQVIPTETEEPGNT